MAIVVAVVCLLPTLLKQKIMLLPLFTIIVVCYYYNVYVNHNSDDISDETMWERDRDSALFCKWKREREPGGESE